MVSAKRLLANMDLHLLHQLFQSAYKIFHSTGTVPFRVHSDIVHALDGNNLSSILLDLFAAFYTTDQGCRISFLIDCNLLLDCLVRNMAVFIFKVENSQYTGMYTIYILRIALWSTPRIDSGFTNFYHLHQSTR